MATSLQTRVKALETSGSGGECPECGWDGITPLRPEFFWTYEESADGPEESVYCSACGRPIHIVLTWGDAPD
jgi:predicted RNA-binding Zn-ribbon protein involved in translation (DUF1610 family)